jgi:hypothetical protein
MLPVGFETTIAAGERPQTYALDCAAIGTGTSLHYIRKIQRQLILKRMVPSVHTLL